MPAHGHGPRSVRYGPRSVGQSCDLHRPALGATSGLQAPASPSFRIGLIAGEGANAASNLAARTPTLTSAAYLSLIAASTFLTRSGGIGVIP
jgi:hypothetical protein